MKTQDLNNFVEDAFGINMFENDPDSLPGDSDELALHMQLNYKQSVELAEEQAINVLLEGNKYELTKRRLYYDLTVLGIASVKNYFTTSEGVKIEYVDPANLVYSYTEFILMIYIMLVR
jgi:predicted Zn-dependent protease